eukprot:4714611-Prymnesium_polylepis.1
MRGAIARHAVDIFEFEKNYKGFWSKSSGGERRTLGALLRWVGELGYECWFQTSLASQRSLVQASGPCWRDEFDDVGWSNLVCAHSPPVRRFLNDHCTATRADLFALVSAKETRKVKKASSSNATTASL